MKRFTVRPNALVIAALLFIPCAVQAQQPSQPKDTTAKRPLTPAETAACSRIIGHAFQNPVVLQQFERFKAGGQSKILETMPDTLRPAISKAVAKGQGDTLKAIARRQLDAKTAATFDEIIATIVGLPDSVRQSAAMLLGNGRPISCM